MSKLKLNLGAGGTILQGWRNMDIMFKGDDYIDITKPLPLADNSVDFIVCGHCVEHVTGPDAFRFFEEAYRVLKAAGVLRIAVPSIVRVYQMNDQAYHEWVAASGLGAADRNSAVKNLIVNHSHLMIWDEATMSVAIKAAGFRDVWGCEVGKSDYPELRGVEGHGAVIGEHNNWVETLVVEAVK